MTISRKKTAELLFIVYLFCAIFLPCLFRVSMGVIVLGISLIVLILNYKYLRMPNTLNNVLPIFSYFIPFLIYLIFIQLYRCTSSAGDNSVYINTLYNNINVFVRAIIVTLSCITVMVKYDINIDEFSRILIAVGCIQLVCVVLALVFPVVRQFFNHLTITNSKYDYMQVATARTLQETYPRGYGLSYNLYDAFGYITSMLILITFITGVDRKGGNRFVILSIMMFIMPLLNTRTGVLLAITGLLVAIGSYFRLVDIFRFALIAIVAFVLGTFIVDKLPDATKDWLNAGLNQTVDLLSTGEKTGIYDIVLDRNIILPDNLLFGEGGFPHYLLNYNTDNGYINCIWNFGIVGTILLFAGYIHMFFYVYSVSVEKKFKTLMVGITIIFFLYLVKLYSITLNGANVLIFCIPAAVLCQRRRK